MELTIDEAIKYFYAGVELEVLFEGADFWIDNKYIPTRFTKDKYRLKKQKESLPDIDYMINVMQAYKEGKEIETSLEGKIWNTNKNPKWDWRHLSYRIKQIEKMENIDYQISVMQAYKNGSTIESTTNENAYWTVNDLPKWNWVDMNYRVKQEPKLTPYTYEDAEVLIGKAVKVKSDSNIMIITGVTKEYIFLPCYGAYCFENFLSDCTHLDGSPCGKLV